MGDGAYVHRLADGLALRVGTEIGARALTPALALVAAMLDGARLIGAEAIGKHLLVHTSAHTLHVHLGSTGRVTPAVGALAADVLRLSVDGLDLDVVRPRVCAAIDHPAVERLRGRLGPDPLRPDADPGAAWARLRAARGTVGDALLDQSVIAGVGNATRAEALHRSQLHPLRRAASLRRDEFARLWRAVVDLMSAAYAAEPAPGAPERPPAPVYSVYRRKRCATCSRPVHRVTIHGRTAYFCPRCQRGPSTRVARRPEGQRRTTSTEQQYPA